MSLLHLLFKNKIFPDTFFCMDSTLIIVAFVPSISPILKFIAEPKTFLLDVNKFQNWNIFVDDTMFVPIDFVALILFPLLYGLYVTFTLFNCILYLLLTIFKLFSGYSSLKLGFWASFRRDLSLTKSLWQKWCHRQLCVLIEHIQVSWWCNMIINEFCFKPYRPPEIVLNQEYGVSCTCTTDFDIIFIIKIKVIV